MDIHMPIMSGYQVLEALQGVDSKIPIIVMSASSNDADRAKAEQLGCCAYLVKPVDVDDVLALADDIVRTQNATQA
jgi:CheY-like chemotaxis protein